MRDELVQISTARQLNSAGLTWQPQVGDWVMLLDGAYITSTHMGLYVIIELAFDAGWVMIRDAEGKWPPTRVVSQNVLWLPTVGQLKTWLRGNQFRVHTLEQPFDGVHHQSQMRKGWGDQWLPQPTTQPNRQNAALRFRCIAFTLDTQEEYTHDALNEVEAVAGVIFDILAKRPAGQ